jgi:hypothetical protein
VLPTDGPGLHLSVGTYAPTVHDYVSWACARHLPAALAARRTLGRDANAADIDGALEALRAALLSPATRAEFERESAGRARQRTELQAELHLALGAGGLTPGDTIAVNAAQDAVAGEIAVARGRLRLHPLARRVVTTLQHGALPLEALVAALAGEAPDAIRAAVLDLAEHDVLTIIRAHA